MDVKPSPDKHCEGLTQEQVERIAVAYFGGEVHREWCVAAINKALREDRQVAARSHVVQNWRYIPANPPPKDTPIELLCADSSVARVDYYDGYGRFHDGRVSNVGGIFWRPVSVPSTTPRNLLDDVIEECASVVSCANDCGKKECPFCSAAMEVRAVKDLYADRFVASAMGTLTERERVVLGNLIHLADAVHHALDDSEELEDKAINVTEEHYNMLCLAVACLDDLPDDKPGYIMCPAAKAQWALRRIMGEQENNAADGGKQT